MITSRKSPVSNKLGDERLFVHSAFNWRQLEEVEVGAQCCGGGKSDKGVADNQVRAVVFCTTIQLPAGTFLNLHCSRIQSVPDVYFRTYHTNLNTVCVFVV